ncbi:MAG: hypothetical protein RLZZ336_1857 [Cyanobacteriota bacterium]|jgi:AGCS family alanine or glycine:cation symporter
MNLQILMDQTNDFLWGLLVDWIAYLGLYLSLGLHFLPLRHLLFGVAQAWRSLRQSDGEGSISSFAALMTAMGGTIGTGCLAGMAITMSVGGPGSLFWLWVVTLVSLATKCAEALLAVRYRSRNDRGELVGGPMHYMGRGLPPSLRWLGLMFAGIGSLATFGLGNGIQAMELGKSLEHVAGMPPLLTGVVLAAVTLLIIEGGIRRISRISSILVPVMVVGYVGFTAAALLMHPASLSRALQAVFNDAFNGRAMAGGSLLIMLTAGVRRAVFTQEGGLGTTPIVHAVARPNDPVLQGMVAMLGTLITAVVSTMTALVVLCSESYLARQDGHTLVSRGFEWALPGSGWVTDLATLLFTFTTIIVFAYYGERCLEYLLGSRSNRPFRLVWAGALVVGCVSGVPWFWTTTEALNALMALPNVIALVLLSATVFRLTKGYGFRPS